jgi:NAD(P)-dependent dehydrogenase (short-subunit alcohol dehydrogenase family)|tara:strand:+ start:8 stop:787 length:780 start_codon:yes stop_codon:yes gene_type:complete
MSFLNKIKLKNKNVYILGGLGLIGSEVVKNTLSMGAKVIILDIKKTKKKNNVKYERFDCSKLSKLEKHFNKIVNKFGCPHIFINCSYPKTNDWKQSSFNQVTLKRMTKNIEIHLNSYAWLSKIVAEKMVKNNINGSIINMNSVYGLLGQDLSIYEKTSIKENMPYSIIMGGMVNLTRQMASYYGRFGVRINSICSGGVYSIKDLNFRKKQFIKNYKKKVPLKRLAKPEEIANVIAFIATDASSYITGSNILVDGGWTII